MRKLAVLEVYDRGWLQQCAWWDACQNQTTGRATCYTVQYYYSRGESLRYAVDFIFVSEGCCKRGSSVYAAQTKSMEELE